MIGYCGSRLNGGKTWRVKRRYGKEATMAIAKSRNQRSAPNNRRGFTALINGKIPMRALPSLFRLLCLGFGRR